MSSASIAQKDTTRNWTLKGYPVVFYTPETLLAFGAFGAFSFQFGEKDSTLNYSQIQFGAAYTLENQLLIYAPFKLYWGENKHYMFGEIGYYKYFYYYHGIGNESLVENEEIYSVNFPRLRLHYSYMALDKWSFGGAYWVEHFNIKERLDGGLVENSVGGEGGVTNGIGPLVVYDSRNDVFYPSKGNYFEAKYLQFPDFFGSAYDFGWGSMDFMKYFSLGKTSVLATHLNWQFSTGNIPFNLMSAIGGTRNMRGYYQGRHRDRGATIAQVEFRQSLPWRFGFVVFGDVGKVYSDADNWATNSLHWTAGAGLRWMLDKERKVNIRLDYGVGDRGNSGFYFTIGEAF